MIKYKTKLKEVEIKELEGIVCDKCGKTFGTDNDYELQEFHHIDFEGGFGSIFGDGNIVKADICQHCLYEIIKDFMRVS